MLEHNCSQVLAGQERPMQDVFADLLKRLISDKTPGQD